MKTRTRRPATRRALLGAPKRRGMRVRLSSSRRDRGLRLSSSLRGSSRPTPSSSTSASGELSMEQRLDARVGPLLALAWNHWVHRALGYSTREAYARERLGMDPTRARALVRLERAAVLSEPFARAYRTGALSSVKAGVLVPLVASDPLGRFMKDWVAWAERVTVRRLRDDVELALALEETDPVAFAQSGGLPPEARGDGGRDREIGAIPRESAEETCSVRFIGPADVVQLFRAVLCTVRRRMESDMGR